MSTAPVWDARNGVYVGNRAAGSDAVPSPLWIFGYGSLCWKTEFPHVEKCTGRVRGLTRYFAQRSQDHRGTPAAPGLVATVVRDEDLVKLALQEEGYTGSCVGTAYRVADEDAQQVLDDLDFREKGGYTREVVSVTTRAARSTRCYTEARWTIRTSTRMRSKTWTRPPQR